MKTSYNSQTIPDPGSNHPEDTGHFKYRLLCYDDYTDPKDVKRLYAHNSDECKTYRESWKNIYRYVTRQTWNAKQGRYI